MKAQPLPFRSALVAIVAVCAAPLAAHAARLPGPLRWLLARLDTQLTVPCLTADVSRVFDDLTAKGMFRDPLGAEFSLAGGSVYPERIDLEIQDARQRVYRITLVPRESAREAPDGQGDGFVFYLAQTPHSPSPQAAKALLAAATLLDQSLPDSAIARCAGHDGSASEHRYPLVLALVGAAAEGTILIVAIWFGSRAIRRPTRPRHAAPTDNRRG